MSTVTPLSSAEDLAALHVPEKSVLILYFHAPWAAPCAQMSEVLEALASVYPPGGPAIFASANAEDLPDLAEDHDVTAVPHVVIKRGEHILDAVSGSDAAKVRAAVERHAGAPGGWGAARGADDLPPAQTVTRPAQQPVAPGPAANGANGATAVPTPAAASNGSAAPPAKNLSAYAPGASDPPTAPAQTSAATSEAELHARLSELVRAAPVMLFMKGTPSAPQCGFSRQLVGILRGEGVRYGFFNILADDEVRQGLKTFADWPTFPQLWMGGELIGGLDIVREELENDKDFFGQYKAVSADKGAGGPAAPEAQKTAVA